jgi:hypothetical protein
MRRKAKRHTIPELVTKAVEYIDRTGLNLEGIFRISGGASSLSDFKDKIDRGK